MRITRAAQQAASETANLAMMFGSEDATDQALAAAAGTRETEVIKRHIAMAEEAAKNESGELDPGVSWILHWFTDKLRQELSPDSQSEPYSPKDGDCIQVTFTGELHAFKVAHPSMGMDTIWEFGTDEGVVIPLTTEDFGTLDAVRLLGAE